MRTSTGNFFLLILLFVLHSNDALPQIVQTGFKGGYQFSWVTAEDPDFRSRTKISPVSGYNVGLVAAFKVKERYFLHTEYLFSTKGKRVTNYVTPGGKPDPILDDQSTYYYIDVPILYNVHFKGKIENKHFKWYAGIGPLFSYWLGGKGTIVSQELIENEFDKIDYKIKFGDRPRDEGVTSIYMEHVRRFQLGLTAGGGIMLEPNNNRSKFMIDMRFELGGTWMGRPESADYLAPSNYGNNMKGRNMGLRASIIYVYETNLSKKSLNKGKSTKKVKKRRL